MDVRPPAAALTALANRTAILRATIRIVDPAKGIGPAPSGTENFGAFREQGPCGRAMRREGGDRDAALGALLKRLESGDAEACGARPWREKKGAGGGGE